MVQPISVVATPAQAPQEPNVRAAQLHLRDARLALERPMGTRSQLEDALRSAQHFMTWATAALHGQVPR